MSSWAILARNSWLLDVVLVLGVFLVFGRALRGSWVFDDWAIEDQEQKFQLGLWHYLRAGGLFAVPGSWVPRWIHFDPRGGRPVNTLVDYAIYSAFGFRFEAWHAVNLLMHAGAVLIVHHLALAFGFSPAPAFTWAAIFAFHPLQVPSVCYISGRAGVQSVLLTLAGLFCWFVLGWWPVTLLAQYLAWRTKEDSILYWVFYPIVYFLFG